MVLRRAPASALLLLATASLVACVSCRRPGDETGPSRVEPGVGQSAATTEAGGSSGPDKDTEAARPVDATADPARVAGPDATREPEPEPIEGGDAAAQGEGAPQEEPEADAVRKPTRFSSDPSLSGDKRAAEARAAKLDEVKALFAAANVSFPPAVLFFRVYKQEEQLEVWAASRSRDPLVHVATYEICYASGDLGPKRREGDSQVPEGFYVLDYYNKRSSYYLSMRVNYPNALDRLVGKQGALGGDIMIHGNCVSIGCMAMSDERIQELWVMANDFRRDDGEVSVHIFPGRDLDGLIEHEDDAPLRDFWANLKEGHDYFVEHRRLPRVGVDRKAQRYTFD